MRILVTLSFCTFLTLLSIQSFSQHRTYVPRETYWRKHSKLVDEVNKLFDGEVKSLRSELSEGVAELNEARKKYFLTLVLNEHLIKDDTLQDFVSGVLKRIENSNNIPRKVRYFFIVKDPVVNASCIGSGVFLINTGLLAKVKTEDELAFVMAHEIAHDELRHTTETMKWLDKVDFRKKQRKRLERLDGELNMDKLAEFRRMNFAFSRINQKCEFEADSLGLILFRKAAYKEDQALSLLQALDEDTEPNYPLRAETFLAFDDPAYPFNEYWLNERLTVFGNRLENSFLFNLDSLSTHPGMPLRKKAVASYLDNIAPKTPKSSQSLPGNVKRIAEFEAVESAFFTMKYDRGLLQAMVLLQGHPHDPYLIARIGGIFLQLYIAKQDGTTDQFVSSYTYDYSEALKLTNHFLHNLSATETAEIAYHFMRRPENFNKENRDHYYVLWKLCELTYKSDEKNSIADRYRKAFGEGIGSHDYELHVQRKLNPLDFPNWGWVFGF